MTFSKDDKNKPQLHLLPPVALTEVCKALEYGAAKYGAHNWRKVDRRSRYYNACMRHLLAYSRGEATDPGSGNTHLSHALASLMFLVECDALNLGTDDIAAPAASSSSAVAESPSDAYDQFIVKRYSKDACTHLFHSSHPTLELAIKEADEGERHDHVSYIVVQNGETLYVAYASASSA